MYAIFNVGGKQYKVSPGDVIRIEQIKGAPGSTIEFTQVHAVRGRSVVTGTPHLENTKVTATLLRNARADKVRVLKYKRKKQYRRTVGHRQGFSEVLIKEIVTPAVA